MVFTKKHVLSQYDFPVTINGTFHY